MAKRRRKDQQHIAQRQSRRRSYGFGGTNQPEVKYRPPFPFNLLQNAKVFYVIGAFVMVGGVVLAAVAGSRGVNNSDPVDIETPDSTATLDGSATPGTTPTPNPRQFSQAEEVIDPAAFTYTATITTSKGEIVIELFAEEAPDTVNNFVFLAQEGYFDGLTF
ncbi:MAG: peptidylprolyl isomerase, partial [Dehalococcoidia bacterium]